MSNLDQKKRRPGGMAGGAFLAISLIAGIVIGTMFRQPSIGALAGFGFGVALMVLVWLLDRRR